MPLARTVFGISPDPHRINEPKSLYQSPSGAVGPILTQSCRWRRSPNEISRSATRASRCSQTGRGRSENRIFGNCGSPEDGTDQVLASLVLLFRNVRRHESLIRAVQTLAGRGFRLDAFFRERHQRPAHCQMFLFRYAPDFKRQGCGYCYALPDRRCRSAASLDSVTHIL